MNWKCTDNVVLWVQVGRGLSKDEKALKLGLQHWLEAVCVLASLHVLCCFLILSQPRVAVYFTYSNAKVIHVVILLLQIDPKHRYGHNLNFYYAVWIKSSTREPFYYWSVSNMCLNLLLPFHFLGKGSLYMSHEIEQITRLSI